MRNLIRLSLLLLTVIVSSPAFAQGPPPAPEGFTWVSAKLVKGIFLLPKGWYFQEEQKGDTSACFITKEKILPGENFSTGITINLITNIFKKTQMSPSQYAQRYIQQAASKFEVKRKETSKMGPFDYFSIELISRDESANPIHMWHIIIANDKTGSAYLTIVESPENAWAVNSPTLEKISSMLGVDDEA